MYMYINVDIILDMFIFRKTTGNGEYFLFKCVFIYLIYFLPFLPLIGPGTKRKKKKKKKKKTWPHEGCMGNVQDNIVHTNMETFEF